MAWKIYFWLLIMLLGYSYYELFGGDTQFYDYFDLPISLIAIFGLFGYAYKKKIFNEIF